MRSQQHQQRREAEGSSSDSERDLQSPFLRASSSSSALSRGERRPRRTSSTEPLQSNASENGSQYLFTPAGDTLPPIATSRSTTALLMKKKQIHQQQQNQLNISSMYPWTGHINGSASSSLNGGQPTTGPPPPPPSMPLPTPDHPPPPYSEACPEPGNTQDLGGPSLNGRRQSLTPSSTFLHSPAASRNQSSTQLYGSPPRPPSASRNRSPIRGNLSAMTESLHRIHAELEGSSAARYSGNVPNSSASAGGHSRTPSSSTSPTHSRAQSQVFNNGTSPPLLRRRDGFGTQWDQGSTSSPSDDSDAPAREESAIYTSPSRKRKGKERATFEDGDGVGMSSSVQLHDTDVHERRHFPTRPGGGQGHYYDERSLGDTDDSSHLNSNGHTPHAMPKSCLKPTPTLSSSNLAGSSTTPASPTQPAKAKPNIGVRFVRFTLGLGGSSKKGKEREREREPKLICTTPGEACAGETETETDEPSLRRLPTARRPPSATLTGKSRLFGFAGWRRGQPAPPPPPLSTPGHHHHPRHTGPSPLSLSSVGVNSANSHHPSTLHGQQQPGSPTRSSSPSSSPPSKFTSFFIQAFRLLSILPALCGIIFCIWMVVSMGALGSSSEHERAREYVQKYWRCVSRPPYYANGGMSGGFGYGGGEPFLVCDEGRGVLRGPPVPGRVDWVVAAAWAFLTAHHCLGLSTGLLARWKVYYTPSSTLVRLLALQGICWPATQLTLTVVGGGRRPAAAWAVIGTCTAVSRSVQIWVTSNIVREEDDEDENENGNENGANANGNASTNATPDDSKPSGSGSGSRVMRFLHAFAAVIGGGSPGDESGDDDGEEGETEHGAEDTPGGATTAEEYDTSTFEFSEVEPDSPITPREREEETKEKEEEGTEMGLERGGVEVYVADWDGVFLNGVGGGGEEGVG